MRASVSAMVIASLPASSWFEPEVRQHPSRSSSPYNTADGGNQAYLCSGGTTTNLVGLGEPDSYAYGINNAGQVVGWAYTPNVGGPAFLYSGGVMTSLGTLGGVDSVAYAINSSGQVVGWSSTGNGAFNAFLYSGIMTNLAGRSEQLSATLMR